MKKKIDYIITSITIRPDQKRLIDEKAIDLSKFVRNQLDREFNPDKEKLINPLKQVEVK